MTITPFGVLLGLALGAIAFFVLDRSRRVRTAADTSAAAAQAARLLEEAKTQAAAIRTETELRAKDTLIQAKAEAEQAARELRLEGVALEKRLAQREETVERRAEGLDARERQLAEREEVRRAKEVEIERRHADATALVDAVRKQLEETAAMTREEAKRSLVEQMVDEARGEAAKHIRQVEAEAREEADRRAKKIISIAIERLAGEFVADRTVSVVQLPSDDMKGRIIGREGRNIRAIEAATGST